MSIISQAFKGLYYPPDLIAQYLRWYLSYALRYLEKIMKERRIDIAHSTLHRWIIRLTSLLEKTFTKHKKAVGPHWRMDEKLISKLKASGSIYTEQSTPKEKRLTSY